MLTFSNRKTWAGRTPPLYRVVPRTFLKGTEERGGEVRVSQREAIHQDPVVQSLIKLNLD